VEPGWIAVALGFNVFVAHRFGLEAGEQFFAAYLLEKSLSVDSLLVFSALKIPAADLVSAIDSMPAAFAVTEVPVPDRGERPRRPPRSAELAGRGCRIRRCAARRA
jgi:hypothetical protein